MSDAIQDGGTRKTVSSSVTFFYKFVLSPLWIGGFGIAALTMLVSGNSGTQRTGCVFAAIWVLLAPIIWVTCGRLKRVKFDGSTLWISNYRTEVSIPVNEVAAITQNNIINLRPVFVTFKRETPWGRKIVFMPKVSLLPFFDDEIVVELRRAARIETR